MADGLDQMTFSNARRPQQQHVLAFLDEAAGGQVEDLLPLDRRIELPVEVFERAHLAEAGGFHTPLNQPVLPDRQFILQDQFQELGVGEVVAGGLLQPDLQRLRQPREPELLEGGVHGVFHRAVLSVCATSSCHASAHKGRRLPPRGGVGKRRGV